MQRGWQFNIFEDGEPLANLLAALIRSAIRDRDEHWLRAFGRDFIGVLARKPEQADYYHALALDMARQ